MSLCGIMFSVVPFHPTATLWSFPTMIDRSAVSRALAKALAFKLAGKPEQAREWARELIRLLELAEILA